MFDRAFLLLRPLSLDTSSFSFDHSETGNSPKSRDNKTGKSVAERIYSFSLREPVARKESLCDAAGRHSSGFESMPNTDSAKRALRKMNRRRAKNRHERSALRTSVKKVRTTAAAATTDSAKVEDAKAVLQLAIKRIDQSAAKNLIHANKASRDKSRLTRLINKLSKPAAPATGAADAPAAAAN